jgi:hypothetical protein
MGEQEQAWGEFETPRRCLNSAESENLKGLGAIASFLRGRVFDPEKDYFRFDIDPKMQPVTPEALRSLLLLPFEVLLTEENGQIVVETGTENEAPGGPEYRKRKETSRLSLHTHYAEEGMVPVNTPSFSDVYVTTFTHPGTPELLVCQSGLLRFGQPVRDAVTQAPLQRYDSPRDVFARFAKSRGIGFFKHEAEEGRELYYDLPQGEKVALQREFAEKAGVIQAEALWSDPRALEPLMRIINLEPEKSAEE